MIVKLQRAQFPAGAPMLVYNQDRSVLLHVVETKPLLERLRGRPKAYFEATLNAVGELDLGDEAPEQPW